MPGVEEGAIRPGSNRRTDAGKGMLFVAIQREIRQVVATQACVLLRTRSFGVGRRIYATHRSMRRTSYRTIGRAWRERGQEAMGRLFRLVEQ